MWKIRNLFRQSSTTHRRSDGSAVEQGSPSSGFCTSLSKKLNQRQLCSWTPSINRRTQPPVHAAQFPVQVAPARSHVLFSDLFASLELTDTPTTPFGIKAFQNTQTRPLSEHVQHGSSEQYNVESLSALEDPDVLDLITQVNAGLPHGPPKLHNLGTGGVYFLTSDHGDTVAVFKPTDEEPKGVNNPKGYKQKAGDAENSLREGIRSGEGALRERAAFLLDHESVSGVPPTTVVSLTSNLDPDLEKIGSLQQYVPYDYDAEECGTGLFSVEEVHKICLADLRFVNTDRNGQNILVRKEKDGRTTLTPIDHGYCFPDALADLYFEWMYWPQAQEPFSPAILRFIEDLDPEGDLEVLRQHDVVFRPECNQVFLFVNFCLKWAVRHNCTPRDIALMLSVPSQPLANTFKLADELSHGTMSESQVYRALDCHSEALMALATNS